MLRPQTVRSPIRMATDKWLRRLGAATFAIVAIGGALLGAPTMLDISNALLKSSTAIVAAPEATEPPPAPPTRQAPAIAVPATPDITADITSAARAADSQSR